MQQNIYKTEQRFCYKCNYPAGDFDNICPRCGGMLRTKSSIRALGGVLVFIGGFIALIMAVVIVGVLGLLSKTPMSSVKGEEGQLMFVFGILALTLAVGVSFAVAGIWQIIFARRNALIVWITLGMVVVLLVAGRIFTLITR